MRGFHEAWHVELEHPGLLLFHEGEVEGDADEVALSSIVALFIVIVDDHVVAVVALRGRHVLEVVQVEWVREDIVRVNALELVAPSADVVFVGEARVLFISQDLHLEVPGVLLLLDGPLAVLIVKDDPVVVDLLVDFDVANLE